MPNKRQVKALADSSYREPGRPQGDAPTILRSILPYDDKRAGEARAVMVGASPCGRPGWGLTKADIPSRAHPDSVHLTPIGRPRAFIIPRMRLGDAPTMRRSSPNLVRPRPGHPQGDAPTMRRLLTRSVVMLAASPSRVRGTMKAHCGHSGS